MGALKPYTKALKVLKPEDVLGEVKNSGLPGGGGAGFRPG